MVASASGLNTCNAVSEEECSSTDLSVRIVIAIAIVINPSYDAKSVSGFPWRQNFENTKEDTVPSNKVLRLVLRE